MLLLMCFHCSSFFITLARALQGTHLQGPDGTFALTHVSCDLRRANDSAINFSVMTSCCSCVSCRIATCSALHLHFRLHPIVELYHLRRDGAASSSETVGFRSDNCR